MQRVLKDSRFLEGLSLFRSGKYFEAHEEWEDLWRDMANDDPLRDFVRGMIMLAAAYHKLLFHGNIKGALGLFRKAFERLEGYSITDEAVKVLVDFSRGFEKALEQSRYFPKQS